MDDGGEGEDDLGRGGTAAFVVRRRHDRIRARDAHGAAASGAYSAWPSWTSQRRSSRWTASAPTSSSSGSASSAGCRTNGKTGAAHPAVGAHELLEGRDLVDLRQ